MNTELESLPWPDNFIDWLQRRNEPASLKSLAFSAIDAFRSVSNGASSPEGPLNILYKAACHPRFVVWEVGLPLLAKLGETEPDARAKVASLSHEKKAEFRRRSILHINDRYSRSFCLSILLRLLTDPSAKVKDVVAGRIACLNLTELIPTMERAIAQEKEPRVRWCYTHVVSLMRNGYHYDVRDDASTLWLYYPEAFPARTVFIRDAQLRFENGENIDKIKADTLRQNSHILDGRRDWDWSGEPSHARESRNRAF